MISKRLLVFGGSGFIGSYLRRRLAQNANFEVTSTYNANPPENIEPEMSRRVPALGPTHIVLNDRENKSNFFESSFGGNEQFVQSRVPMFAMDLVRRSLLGVEDPHPF